jgi:serine/threonine protein kinase
MITPSIIANRSPEPSPTAAHQQIPYEQLGDQEIVGRGVSGIVKKAYWRESTVAIKYLYDSREVHMELKNLKMIFEGRHVEHIIKFYGLTTNNEGNLGIVMEYCANGTLCDYLESNFQQLTWEDKFNMAQEIARGLQFVHQQGLLHRDLHDGNILIDDGGHALIADFGLARPIDRDNTTGDTKGRPAFIPPERLRGGRGRGPFTEKGDVYSLGVILWELTSGRQPFHGMSYADICNAVSKVLRGKREKPVDGTPKWYREIYTMCWATDPNDRPSMDLVVLFLILQSRYRVLSMFTGCRD